MAERWHDHLRGLADVLPTDRAGTPLNMRQDVLRAAFRYLCVAHPKIGKQRALVAAALVGEAWGLYEPPPEHPGDHAHVEQDRSRMGRVQRALRAAK